MLDFSIIIPTFQRPVQLSACLDALSRLDYECSRWEVIVVDDGSESPAEEVVRAAASRLAVRMLRRPHAGPAAARNAGATEARGRYLVFTDDDCRPSSGWLKTIAAGFASNGNCVIGGKIVNAVDGNIYAAASQLLLDYLYEHFNAEPEHARMLASCNVAMPAAIFLSVGGFDIKYPNAAAEDREICDRLRHHGHRLVYLQNAVVMHHHVLSLRRFWRQHYNYGTGAFRYHSARAVLAGDRIRVEPSRYYWKLLRYPSTVTSDHTAVLTALFFLSQIANAIGFFRAKLAHSLRGT